jgi:hypothetical protein
MRDVTGLILAGYLLLCHLDAGYYLDEAKLQSGLDKSINQILDCYLNPVHWQSWWSTMELRAAA